MAATATSTSLAGLPRRLVQDGIVSEEQLQEATDAANITAWRLTAAGQAVDVNSLTRAPRQATAMAQLHRHPEGVPRDAIEAPASVLNALADKGWIESFTRTPAGSPATGTPTPKR